MKSKLLYGLVCACLQLGSGLGANFTEESLPPADEAQFYVSAQGSDEANGTLNDPFRSLSRAKEAVAAYKSAHPNQSDIVVYIRGGSYRLNDTVVFSLLDSGDENQRIVYAAFPGERPVLHGSKKISGWELASQEIGDLPSKAQGKVYVADIPYGWKKFHSLYVRRARQLRTRSESFKSSVQEYGEEYWGFRNTFHFGGNAPIRDWDNIQDIELLLRPAFQWTANVLPLTSVDMASGELQLGAQSAYASTQIRWVRTTPDHAWIENAIEHLDGRRKWCVNFEDRKVYFWPRKVEDLQYTYAPQLIEFIRIEGSEITEQPVQNLHFSGLSFIRGKRHTVDNDTIALNFDWAEWNKATAVFRMKWAKNCSLTRSLISATSGDAVRLDLYSQGNEVCANEISNVGGVGVGLYGYGPSTKDVHHGNQVNHNHIRDVGQIYWHAPAVTLWQSGSNQVAHNYIHHCPGVGITMLGAGMPRELGVYRDVEDILANPDSYDVQQVRKVQARIAPFRLVNWNDVDWPKLTAEEYVAMGEYPGVTWPEVFPYYFSKNNVIEYNEIHHVCETLGDNNPIYMRFNNTGNEIRYNYIHDIIGYEVSGAIRADGQSYGQKIHSNLIKDTVAGGIETHFANEVENNIIYNVFAKDDVKNIYHMPTEAYFPTGPGPNDQKIQEDLGLSPIDPNPQGAQPYEESVFERNVILAKGGVVPKIYESWEDRNYSERDRNIWEIHRLDDNLYHHYGVLSGFEHEFLFNQANGQDNQTSLEAPLFVNLDETQGAIDLGLQAGSPLGSLGFVSWDISAVGLGDAFPDWLQARVYEDDDPSFPLARTDIDDAFEITETFEGELVRPSEDYFQWEGSETAMGVIETGSSARLLRFREDSSQPEALSSMRVMHRYLDSVGEVGRMAHVKFRVRLKDENSEINMAFLPTRDDASKPGPSGHFGPEGKVTIRTRDRNRKLIGSMEVGRWYEVEYAIPLNSGRRRYEMTLTKELDGSEQRFNNLEYDHGPVKFLSDLLFRHQGDKGVVYLDDVEVFCTKA